MHFFMLLLQTAYLRLLRAFSYSILNSCGSTDYVWREEPSLNVSAHLGPTDWCVEVPITARFPAIRRVRYDVGIQLRHYSQVASQCVKESRNNESCSTTSCVGALSLRPVRSQFPEHLSFLTSTRSLLGITNPMRSNSLLLPNRVRG